MNKNMTRGNIVGALINFSIPLIFSGLLQQLFNWADAFIVGNIEGELALAAIGSTTIIYNLFIMLIIGFTSGLSILTAQLYGKGKTNNMKKILSSFTAVFCFIFLIVSLIFIIFTDDILSALHTPDNIFKMSSKYLNVILLGIPFLAIYNVYSAVLKGMGDSSAPFIAIIISSIINITLDIILVGVFHYGITGAAVATVFSQVLMTIFIICYSVIKYKDLRFRIGNNMISKTTLCQGLTMGLPVAIQSGIGSFGNLILQNFMNGFGTQTVAAITTAYRVDSVILLPIINLSAGISTVVAQNTGAGNNQRAKKTLIIGSVIMVVISILLTMLVVGVGGTLISAFGVTQEATAIGKNFFDIIATFYLINGLAMALRGYIEGIGDVIFSGIAGISALIIRIILSYSLATKYGNMVIAYAEAFSWGALLIMYSVRLLFKRRIKRIYHSSA